MIILGTRVPDPVNQWVLLNQFREHASRFAHQLDAAMGHHTLVSAAEEDRLTTLYALSDMIGSAWMRYKVWEAVDPEELIIGGNYDGTPLWKRTESGLYVDIDVALCGQCDIATFARRFLVPSEFASIQAAAPIRHCLFG